MPNNSELSRWMQAYNYLSLYVAGFFDGYGISEHKSEKLTDCIDALRPEFPDPEKVYNFCHFCGSRFHAIPLVLSEISAFQCDKCGKTYDIARHN